jgi:hypothetical protein
MREFLYEFCGNFTVEIRVILVRKEFGRLSGAKRRKTGFALQVLGFAYANPVDFPLQSLAPHGLRYAVKAGPRFCFSKSRTLECAVFCYAKNRMGLPPGAARSASKNPDCVVFLLISQVRKRVDRPHTVLCVYRAGIPAFNELTRYAILLF